MQSLGTLFWSKGRMHDLGTLGGASSWAFAISSAGRVVGYSFTTDGVVHAFRWAHGRMEDLGTLGGRHSLGYDINAAGQVVGCASIASNLTLHAFVYDEATGMADLNAQIDPALGWELVRATAINDAGQIVGAGIRKGQRRAFRLTPR